MTFQRIVLEEYSRKPATLSFENKFEALKIYDKIKRTNEIWKTKLGLASDPFDIKQNGIHVHLLAKGITGFINIGEIQIEVRPKFLSGETENKSWRLALTQALILTNQESYFDSNLAFSNTSDFYLPDLMAEAFLNSVEQGLLFGLPRSYNEQEEFLAYYRGSYNSSQFVNHLMSPHLIPCKYDEYTTDNTINQLIKYAASELSSTVISSRLSIKIKEMEYAIEAKYRVPSKGEVDNIYLPPQFKFLEEAIQIAKLLLDNKSLEHNMGDIKLRGFLWNSAVIFEKIVKLVVKKYCISNRLYKFTDKPLTLMQLGEQNSKLKASMKVNTYPDVRILKNGKTEFLLDAKYKTWQRQPKNNDIYQVLAGCRVANCNKAFLIYPLPSNEAEDALIYNIEGEGQPQKAIAIFLDIKKLALPNGINKLVYKLKDDLESMPN